MALVYRETKGEALTFAELDGNFQYFTGSHAITGSLIVTQTVTANSFSGPLTGSFTGSFNGLGTGSFTGSFTGAGSGLNFSGLPTSSAGLTTGSLWVSGSDGSGSMYLMVFNP